MAVSLTECCCAGNHHGGETNTRLAERTCGTHSISINSRTAKHVSPIRHRQIQSPNCNNSYQQSPIYHNKRTVFFGHFHTEMLILQQQQIMMPWLHWLFLTSTAVYRWKHCRYAKEKLLLAIELFFIPLGAPRSGVEWGYCNNDKVLLIQTCQTQHLTDPIHPWYQSGTMIEQNPNYPCPCTVM